MGLYILKSIPKTFFRLGPFENKSLCAVRLYGKHRVKSKYSFANLKAPLIATYFHVTCRIAAFCKIANLITSHWLSDTYLIIRHTSITTKVARFLRDHMYPIVSFFSSYSLSHL